jgi:stage II sporulation protein D
MKRTGPARRLAFLSSLGFLSASALLLSSCATGGSKAGASGSVTAGSAGNTGVPEEQARADSAASTAIPFPEVLDTLSWDLPDSARSDSGSARRPATPSLPAASRPDSIVQRPRPRNLPDRVHVLLSRSKKPLSLYSLGDMQVLSEGVSEGPGAKAVTVNKLATLKGRFTIRRTGAGFTVERNGKPSITTPSRRLRLISVNPYNLVDVNTSVYRGSLHLIGEANGDISAVNVLGVEDYLRGVLPYELGTVDRDALEALKAQAIVARTYTYKRMMRPGAGDFHVYSDVQDQVYRGVKGEYLLSDRAIWETRNMAVIHADTLAICYYFSTCGGRTASKHEVWGGDSIPYLVTRPDLNELGDPFCQASKYSSWNQQWTPVQMASILRQDLRSAGVSDFPPFSRLQGFDVSQRAACGRIRLLTIRTDRGPIRIKGDKVRWAMRPSAASDKILPSAFFDVKMADGKITAQGKAFGHGVGLCQVGAIGRAKAGQNFRQIIEAYYTGVQVVEFK